MLIGAKMANEMIITLQSTVSQHVAFWHWAKTSKYNFSDSRRNGSK